MRSKTSTKRNGEYQRFIRWARDASAHCLPEVWRMTPQGYRRYERDLYDWYNMRRPDKPNYMEYLCNV